MATRKKPASAAAPAPASAPKATAKGAAAWGDFGKMLEKFKLPGVDVAAIMESQRKDMEALAEANRLAYEGIQALAQRRNEILLDSLAEWQAAVKEGALKGGLSKQAELGKQRIEQAMANIRELAEMEAASRSKAWKVVQDRFQENLANLQKLLKPR